MIAWALLAVAATPRLTVVEDPGARRVVVQAWIPADAEDGGPDWALLGRSLLSGTRSHTKDELHAYGSQAGSPPRVDVLPDLIRVEVAAPTGGLDVAMRLLASIVREPLLEAEDLAGIKRRPRTADAWSRALWPSIEAASKAPLRSIRELHARCFRPERIVVAVGGSVKSEPAREALATSFADWKPGPAMLPDWRATPPSPPSAGTGIVEWTGPVRRLVKDDAAFYLSSVALGVGKAGALHRVLREGNALTYRQEALWWPTRAGWRLRSLVARSQAWPDGFDAKAALLADVKAWGQPMLERAVAAGTGGLDGTFLPGPIWLDMQGPISPVLSDRVAMAGYRTLIGGEGLTKDHLSAPSIEELRAAAISFLGG